MKMETTKHTNQAMDAPLDAPIREEMLRYLSFAVTVKKSGPSIDYIASCQGSFPLPQGDCSGPE